MSMTNEVTVVSPMEKLLEMALSTCISPNTRKAYEQQLRKFLLSGRPFTREGVALYMQSLRESGASVSTQAATLSAIKHLAKEAQIRSLLSFEDYSGIQMLKPGKQHRTRTGRWLTPTQVKDLLSLPDANTWHGKRDAALISLLVGCGLRRAELLSLDWEQYQPMEGRMVLRNVQGKGRKPRTVPVPLWAQPLVDRWQLTLAQQPEPEILTHLEYARASQRLKRGREYNGDLICAGISYSGVEKLLARYSELLDVELSAHDLRRTLAQMMRKAGAALEQIQMTLGHADVSTTMLYLGSDMEMGAGKAAVDMVPITTPEGPRQQFYPPPRPPAKLNALGLRKAGAQLYPQRPRDPWVRDWAKAAVAASGRKGIEPPSDPFRIEPERDREGIGIGSAEGKGKGGGIGPQTPKEGGTR